MDILKYEYTNIRIDGNSNNRQFVYHYESKQTI